MRLVENLRKAEKKSAMTIRRGVDRAREEWADLERRLRQRMRIYPQKRAMAAAAAGNASAGPDEAAEGNGSTDRTKPPIVSVHGRDLKED